MNTPTEPIDGIPLEPATARSITRREWLRRLKWGAIGIAGGVIADTFLVEPHWLEIVRRDLPVRNLPPHWHHKLLAQISDVHVGAQVSDDYLVNSFGRVAAIKPDLVAVTGDFVTCPRKHNSIPLEQAARVYAHLPRGKTATLGCLGNHDYGPDWSDPLIAAKVESMLNDVGLKMLRNESIDLEGLTVVGLDDLLANRCDGRKGLAGTSDRNAKLVLCHNPDAADSDFWDGFDGWILSGHTHGGQCKPPFFPPPALPVANRRYTAGEFALAGNRRMYINRGLGHLLPVRFNCRPEVTVFRLTALEKQPRAVARHHR